MDPERIKEIESFEDSDDLFEFFLQKDIKTSNIFWDDVLNKLNVVHDNMKLFYFFMSNMIGSHVTMKKFYSEKFTHDEVDDCFKKFLDKCQNNLEECFLVWINIFENRDDFDAEKILDDLCNIEAMDKINVEKLLKDDYPNVEIGMIARKYRENHK